MKQILLATTVAVFSQTTAAFATDLSNMSDSEREAFGAEVRAYILDNPGIIMEAVAVLEKRQEEAQVVNDQELIKANSEDIYNDGVSFVGGNPNGDITIVEFSDYRCPYCKRARPEVEELVKSDGNIRIIYKEFPILGPDSTAASKFALATLLIAPQSYESMSKALMAMRGKPTDASLIALAKDIGLDGDALLEKTNSNEVNQIIQANRALGQRLKISGTPSFILGNQMLRGYVPLDQMREIVKEARKQ